MIKSTDQTASTTNPSTKFCWEVNPNYKWTEPSKFVYGYPIIDSLSHLCYDGSHRNVRIKEEVDKFANKLDTLYDVNFPEEISRAIMSLNALKNEMEEIYKPDDKGGYSEYFLYDELVECIKSIDKLKEKLSPYVAGADPYKE